MWTRTFWIQALERAIKATAEGILAIIGCDGLGIIDVGYEKLIYVGLMSAVASVLTSIGSLPLGTKGTPSAVRTEVAQPLATSSAAAS